MKYIDCIAPTSATCKEKEILRVPQVIGVLFPPPPKGCVVEGQSLDDESSLAFQSFQKAVPTLAQDPFDASVKKKSALSLDRIEQVGTENIVV